MKVAIYANDNCNMILFTFIQVSSSHIEGKRKDENSIHIRQNKAPPKIQISHLNFFKSTLFIAFLIILSSTISFIYETLKGYTIKPNNIMIKKPTT